jgi:hypothetical protein
MAFEWSMVIGPLIGAGIGLTGEWTGRRSARHQAERVRSETLREAQEERELIWERERRDQLEGRQIETLREVLRLLCQLPGIKQLRDPASGRSRVGPEVRGEVDEFMRLVPNIGREIREPALRERVLLARSALDASLSNALPGYEAHEVVFIIRDTLRDSIGSRLRDDPLPPASQDWVRLRAAALEAEATWKAQLRRDGFDVWSWIDQLDSTPEHSHEPSGSPPPGKGSFERRDLT